MRLSAFKNDEMMAEVDLSAEIVRNDNSRISFLIGRADDCHLVLDDKQVSREHAEVIHQDGKWNVKQMSEYGNLVINGNFCAEKELNNGDLIVIGPFTIHVNLDQHDQAEPLLNVGSSGDDPTKTERVNLQNETKSIIADISDDQEEVSEIEMEENRPAENINDELNDSLAEDDKMDDNSFEETEFQDSSDGDQIFPVDSFDNDDSTKVVKTFAKFELEIFGEYSPYDKFLVTDKKTYIGRDSEKCQIVLNDSEVSNVHAAIKKDNMNFVLEDFKSSNGTLLNGKRINSSILVNDDEFIIGGTTFTVHVSSELLNREKNALMPVEENQTVEVEEIVEVSADFNEGELVDGSGIGVGNVESQGNTSILKDPVKRKKLLYGLVGLLLLYVLFDDDSGTKKKPKKGKDQKSRLLKDQKDQKRNMAQKEKVKLSPEQEEMISSYYLLAKEFIEVGKYRQAMEELESVFSISREYMNGKQLYEMAKEGVARLEDQERKRQAEVERKIRMEKVKKLVEQARKAVKERKSNLAEALFSKILEIDPENFDVPLLKNEMEDWKKEEEKREEEQAKKEAEVKKNLDFLAPSKSYFFKKEWYKAIMKLEEFFKIKNMDEDILKEATAMYIDSQKNLKELVSPLTGKARSLKEGQDLKGAYETYLEVIKHDPSNVEALNEMNEISTILNNRSRKIYREAIISESLSLFDDAKEKFQEVQQISPTNNEYYKKATDKLRDYLD